MAGGGRRVVVSAPSHVHAGNVDIHGGLGRLYGTLGFALEEPRLRVVVEEWEGFEAEGPRAGEALGYARLYCRLLGCRGLRVRVLESIPAHVGLGSTTPLALSIGVAASMLAGRGAGLEELALAAGRSTVSALGLYAFKYGGFIVDGGYPAGRRGAEVPPLIFRARVPGDVAVVVALPEALAARVAPFKEREEEVLDSMPVMDECMAARNARLVLMGVLPAMASGDYEAAARLLHRFNAGLGDYWAARQGGRYCCPEVEELVEAMLAAGGWCACQSSWGPTIYSLTPRSRARGVARAAGRVVEGLGGGRVWVTRVDNTGAQVEVGQGG